MGEMIENMRMLRQANKEYRQDLGRKRIYLFKRHVEAEILNETEYSIRFRTEGQIFDFYPQKCRLFDLQTKEWRTLNRKYFITHIKPLIRKDETQR